MGVLMLDFSNGRTRARAFPKLAMGICLAPLLLQGGCAAFPTMTTNVAHSRDITLQNDGEDRLADAREPARRAPERLTIPPVSAPTSGRPPATEAQINALLSDEQVDATLGPQPIPQFLATVFNLLGIPYTLGPDVVNRTELLAGGSGGSLSKRTLFRLTQRTLKQFGIDVYIEERAVIVSGGETSSAGFAVSRTRTTPSTAGAVVQFFPVQTIEVGSLQTLLTDLVPNLGGVRIAPDETANAFIISGPGQQVAQVTRILRELDQPRFAGSDVLRIEPVYLSTEQLAKALEDVLRTEGYVVATGALVPRPVLILPFPSANQILVFSKSPEALERANYWVAEIDRPAAMGDKATTFVYQVRNTDAQSLGSLAMGQSSGNSQIQPPTGVPGTAPSRGNESSTPSLQGASGQFLNGRLLVDPIGNRVLFTGTATEYAQLRTLLTTLDVPAPQVVIEVMIAEVTLTDSTSLGVNLFGRELRGDGTATGSTEGIDIGGGALNFTFVGPDYRAQLVANASNNRVNILQRPQLVARSGGTSRFQVGTDVPIITSQSASNSQTGGSSDILQSVQYRQTGTILEISPVVYGDRVDLTINQELSSAGDSTGSIASPPILNRSLSTQIAVRDGWTGVLGGMIGNNYTKNNAGVPFLKDLPVVGSAFQNNRVTGSRTELLLLVTPYIIRDDEEMADFADEYSASMNAAFRTGRGWSYTLTPWSAGGRFRGLGFDLPGAMPGSELPAVTTRRGRTTPESETPEEVDASEQ